MKPDIALLLRAPGSARLRALLSERGHVTEFGSGNLADARIFVTQGVLKTDLQLLQQMPRLQLVCCTGTGFDGVDLQAAKDRGIVVTHSPSLNSTAVADMAMGLMIAAVRNIVHADRLVRAGEWQGSGAARLPLVRGLTGRRLGIYGLGAIGRKIASRASAFDMEVGYFSRRRDDSLPCPYFTTLSELAVWCDILMVAVRADPSTRHSVDADILRAVGPEGFVVNIARGFVVDQAALIDALESRQLGGAGLDVYENEPAVPDALKRMDRVVMTPHIASTTIEAQEAQEDSVLANIDAFLSTGKPVTPVPGQALR